MLAQAGFADVDVRAGYREEPATAADTTVVFVAKKDGKAARRYES
jgi:hypothetical protein